MSKKDHDVVGIKSHDGLTELTINQKTGYLKLWAKKLSTNKEDFKE